MSEPDEQPNVETEDPEVLIVDPDDYQRTKKLETIHKTRQQVIEIRQSKTKMATDNPFSKTNWQDVYNAELREAVSQYGIELYPILKVALEEGTLSEDSLIVDTHHYGEVHIFGFIDRDGIMKREDSDDIEEFVHPVDSLKIYRRLDTLMQQLGLTLDLEETKPPAQI